MSGHTVTSDATSVWFWSNSGICALPEWSRTVAGIAYDLRESRQLYRTGEPLFKKRAANGCTALCRRIRVAKSRGGADDEEDQKGADSGMLTNFVHLARSNFSRARKCASSRHTRPRMQTSSWSCQRDWRGGTARQRDRLMWRRTLGDILLDKGYDILVFIEKPNRRKVSGDGTKKAKTKAAR
jgi:hypothetical protein